jgi:hypothetical protein
MANVWRRRFVTRLVSRLVLLATSIAATASCGDVVRQGRGPVFLVIDRLEASAGGATAGELSGTLRSDVITNMTSPDPCTTTNVCPTVFDDMGSVALRLVPKDLGTPTAPTVLSTNNEVTITRYRVSYRRADGRNTPGVDVPHGFDGAVTGTISAGSALGLTFELVRHVSKMESPLVELKFNSRIIAMIADVTFFGVDRVGNEVNASGGLLIEFGNFGD